MVFVDDDKETAEKQRTSIVAPAQRSPKAEEKVATKRTEDGFPVHSFQTLLKDLATLTKNHVQARVPGAPTFIQYSTPTPLQQKAFDLLGVSVGKMRM
jgi:hypothetical protein